MLLAACRALVLLAAGVVVAAVGLPAWAADPPNGVSDPFGTPRSVAQPDPFAAPAERGAAPFAAPAERGADPFAAPTTRAAKPAVNSPTQAAELELRTWSGIKPETMKPFEDALKRPTATTFIDEPLDQAIRSLSENHKIPMFVDTRSLEEIGLSGDVPVTLDVKNVSLRSVLRLLLDKLDLTYVLQNEVLLITTKESAEKRLAIAVYRLDKVGINAADGKALVTQMVSPDAWEELGGASSIAAMSNEVKGEELLVVSATQNAHAEVLELLHTIAKQNVTNLKAVNSKPSGGH